MTTKVRHHCGCLHPINCSKWLT
ncbi:hypothetical protein DXT74_20220 [Chromobacterium sp. Rain0013]|nr:hypothetical protein DXT74_20220 [Chromobacterium sp. Rain0013]